MNLLDIASYLPKLGRLTASLATSAEEEPKGYSSRYRTSRKSVRAKKDGAVMLVKKPAVTSHPNAYRSAQWTRPQSPVRKQKKPSITKASQSQKKKRSARPASCSPEKLMKSIAEIRNTENAPKDLRLIQQAIDEFKTERDQFVHSLGGLQRKLLKFRIPNLFSTTLQLEKIADKAKLLPLTEKKINENSKEKSNRKRSRAKDVRSVSQHFYLADMTESESASSSSSSSSSTSSSDDSGDAEEIELAKRKVSKYLDFDLIPIQPPENRRLEKSNSLLIQGKKSASRKSAIHSSGKPLNAQMSQLRRNVSEMAKKIPTKAEAAKQKATQKVSSTRRDEAPSPHKCESWSQRQPPSPKTRAAVTSEFRKLKKASEMKLRNKLKGTVTNISLPH